MAIDISNNISPHTLHLVITGKLSKNDYDQFVPQFEKLLDEESIPRLLVELRDFKGWEIAALWEELKFDGRHRNDLDRIAIVGDRNWQEWMTNFSKPFTTAEVRFFETPRIERAKEWIYEGVATLK